jgi:hypothetical protein
MDFLPFKIEKLQKILIELDCGSVDVKTKGTNMEPESIRNQIKLKRHAKSNHYVLALVAIDKKTSVYILDPLSDLNI